MNYPSSEPAVFTVGYGSRTVEEMIALLKRNGVGWVVDVRSAPFSRFKPEFSKHALDAAVTDSGLRYVFLGDALGGRPDDPTCYADGKVDYDLVRVKEFYLRGIKKLEGARMQGVRLGLMCSEGRPEECHRSKLIGVTLTETGIPVIHLDEEGIPRTQEEVIARLTEGQLGLFEEITYTSRKRYADDESAD
jgi:uncharacterized protein (DUF488 family)